VRDVLVGGRFAKRDGRLLRGDLGTVREELAASGARILGRLDIQSVSRQVAAQ